MLKFIHAADIHLDSPMRRLETYDGAPVETLRNATRKAFSNLIDLALTEGVDFVIIAGDLFDGDWKDYNTGLFFVNQMARLREADIRVFMVSGNHDSAGRLTKSLRYPDNVALFPSRKPETRVLETLGVAIHGQSFPKAAVTENLAAGYPPPEPGVFNIAILHTAVTGREGHEPYAPCKLDDFKQSGYDYWALGHVHQHEVLLDDPLAVFPGCIQGRHIRETGPKGCVLVSVEPGHPAVVEFHTLDVVRWATLTVDVSACTTHYDCLDAFASEVGTVLAEAENLPLVLRVIFAGRTRAHERLAADPELSKEEVRAAALSAAGERVWVEKVRIATSPVAADREVSADTGPLGVLTQHLDELLADPERIAAMGDSLKDLFRKLPHEFRHPDEEPRYDSVEWIGGIIEQIRPMLLHRLENKDEHE
jgi:exonuclease SbcD